jgi:hypothetical protein
MWGVYQYLPGICPRIEQAGQGTGKPELQRLQDLCESLSGKCSFLVVSPSIHSKKQQGRLLWQKNMML